MLGPCFLFPSPVRSTQSGRGRYGITFNFGIDFWLNEIFDVGIILSFIVCVKIKAFVLFWLVPDYFAVF